MVADTGCHFDCFMETASQELCEGEGCPGFARCIYCFRWVPMDKRRSRFVHASTLQRLLGRRLSGKGRWAHLKPCSPKSEASGG